MRSGTVDAQGAGSGPATVGGGPGLGPVSRVQAVFGSDFDRRLAEIQRENTWLLAELQVVGACLRSARGDAGSGLQQHAGLDPEMGRLRDQWSGLLTFLRANRHELRDLLGPSGAEPRDG